MNTIRKADKVIAEICALDDPGEPKLDLTVLSKNSTLGEKLNAIGIALQKKTNIESVFDFNELSSGKLFPNRKRPISRP